MSKNLHFKSFFYMIKPCCHIYPSNPHGAIDLSLAQLFPTPSQKASGFAVSTVLGPPAKLPPARWLHCADGMVQFSTKPCLLPWDMATHSNSRYPWWPNGLEALESLECRKPNCGDVIRVLGDSRKLQKLQFSRSTLKFKAWDGHQMSSGNIIGLTSRLPLFMEHVAA